MNHSTGSAAERPADEPLSWDTAARIAGRLARPGPVAPREDLEALVADLRRSAVVAAGHVRRLTALSRVDGGDPARARVLVVDRPGWARANVSMLRTMADAALPKATGSLAFAARGISAAQIGSVLAALSSRVLGQFDPYASGETAHVVPGVPPTPPGRLLLVAPNVYRMERELGAPGAQFRLWVCLHEQTHAAQFGAAPWLADHLEHGVRQLLESLVAEMSGRLAGRAAVKDLADGIVRAVTEQRRSQPGGSGPDLERAAAESPLIGAVLNHEQRRMFAELSAVMSLLEGHADVTMDAVGADVLPAVRSIRTAFESRRSGRGAIDRVLRRLLGLDLKLAQYRDGAAFVRAVHATLGIEGFNAVWSAPELLPTPEEIADPARWVRRVHG